MNAIASSVPEDQREARKYQVEVAAFIPYSELPLIPGFDGKWVFEGDDRGIGEDGTSRLKQTIIVETDPKISKNPLIWYSPQVGKTTDLATGESGYAYDSTFENYVSRTNQNGGDNVKINVSASGSNPLVPVAPSIDYEYEINIVPQKNTDKTKVTVTGQHDGFPAHEVTVTDLETGEKTKAVQYMPKSPKDVFYGLLPFTEEDVDYSNLNKGSIP